MKIRFFSEKYSLCGKMYLTKVSFYYLQFSCVTLLSILFKCSTESVGESSQLLALCESVYIGRWKDPTV